jgi:hypothetical protein
MKAENEIWQVMSQGEVYQADLPTLKQWVSEGLVQPSDQVRKGSLKWIEAQRAPMLRRVFTGEEQPPFEPLSPASDELPSPLVESPQPAEAVASQFNSGAVAGSGVVEHAHASTQSAWHGVSQAASQASTQAHYQASTQASWGEQEWSEQEWSEPSWGAQPGLDAACHFHPAQAATLVCRGCQVTFCRSCPNQMGTSTVLLCPLCGNFCDKLEGVQRRQKLYNYQSEGFGFTDFGTAIAYPFKHLASLIGGALLYSIVQFGGLYGSLLAPAILFGCISLVIHRVGNGKIDRDFLPDFSDFSFWDDVLVPFALGVGVLIVTLGPLILLVVALFFGAFGGGDSARPAFIQPPAQKQIVTGDDLAKLSGNATPEEEAEIEKKLQAMHPSSQMAQHLDDSKQSDNRLFGMVKQLIAHPGLILILALLGIGWAVLYHPMALLVAGWTENLKSVLNPLVGLDTMRHMGLNYVKAFLMYMVVQGFAVVVSIIIAIVTSPFNMPLVGNLPGKFLDGIFTFYTSLVIACVLGLSLFKSADRLGIEID